MQRVLLLLCVLLLCFVGAASGQILSVSCTPSTGPTTAGVTYSATCTASGGIAPYSWSIRAGVLPAGLTGPTPSADTTTATIAGVPTVSGSYSYTVQVTDSTPVIPMTATQSYSGTVAPSITSISPTSATAGQPGFTLTVNGAGFNSDAVVNFNGTALATTVVNSNQVTASVPMTSIALAGTYSITVTSGGATSNSANFTVTPTVTSLSPDSATAGGPAFTLTVNGTGFTSGAQVEWNGSSLATHFVSNAQVTAPVLQDLIASQGTATVAVLSSGLTSNTETFTILPPPAITSINPATVTAGGPAFTLTVNGSGFASGSVVQWNGSALTTNVLSVNEVTASVPASDIANTGSAQITVKSGGVNSNSETLTIVAGPAVSALSPNTITAGSATFTITVSGTAFASGATVLWNGSSLATSFESANELTANVPANLVANVGTAQVSVSSGGVTSNALTFTIVAAPTISSISPNTITAGSAAFTMTVNGSGFASGASVNWNGTPLGTVFVSATQLTATVLASNVASPGTDQVTVSSGGVTSNSVNFTVVSGPAITSINPTIVTAGSGAFNLTVNGTGFASGATVLWNNSTLSTTFKSSTQLTASVPASDVASTGTASITVKSGGVSSNAVSFSVTASASISSLSPSSITGGTGSGLGAVGTCPSSVAPVGTLTINGSGFASGATAKWNGDPLVTTVVSSTQLTACVPSGFIQGYGPQSITVTSGSTTTNSATITLVLPSVTLTGLQTTSAPTQQLTVGVQFGAAAATALSGTLTLSFSPNAAGVSAGYKDPALQFSSGGTTLSFTIPKGSSSVTAGTLQQGTVAGTITVTLPSLTANGTNYLPAAVAGTVTIPQAAPVITAGSVQVTNVTSSGFEVVLTGYSTSREMNTATFTFTAASGTQFSGTTTFPVDVSSAFTTWYSSSGSQPEGSLFMLTVPFTISGPTTVLGSVSVTLTNSIGTSAPVSGTP